MNSCKEIKYYIKNNELDLEKIINEYSSYTATIIDNMARNSLNDEDKEEIVSEVFFILWKNKNKLNVNKYLSSYIAGITRNVVKEYLRKVKINFNISDYENSLYNYDKIDLLDDNVEEISKIEEKLKNMKKIDKTIFLDFYYSFKSIKDIAKEQKISEFSVKQRLYRIRNKIRKEGKIDG
ncbi:MAG: RNA polymerase sigma factor [Clostridia bacterium]